MKALVLTAALGAMVLGTLPASAEIVVRERHNGVTIRHVDRGHHHGWRRHRAECKTVKVRTRLPNGNVIIKTRRSC